MPWERNEPPDFSSESHDFYVEEYFTKKVRTHSDGSANRKTKNWYVAIAIEKATGTRTWVVSNGAEIIRDTRGIEGIAVLTDIYRFVNRR
jgi:hypothetical protein